MHTFSYGSVPDGPRRRIHVVRVVDGMLSIEEIDDLIGKMRERMLAGYGEQLPVIVVVQGDSKETLRLFGDSHDVARVRAAMFNAAISWNPIDLE
jgi:hypothetical protein